jgi:hypothetical protein
VQKPFETFAPTSLPFNPNIGNKMKKDNNESDSASKPLTAKRGAEREAAKLVDKAPHQTGVESVEQGEEIRPVDVDVVHRFGKNSGSK